MSDAPLELDEVTTLIEEAVQALPGSVEPETELEELDGWDSMGLLSFIELVQERTGVELTPQDLRTCPLPTDVAALIERERDA